MHEMGRASSVCWWRAPTGKEGKTHGRATHTSLDKWSKCGPIAPLADGAPVAYEEQPLVALYRAYGPVFRLPQPGKEPRIILAGPEANVFMARYEDDFFTTREHWQAFDAAISQNRGIMTKARDGEANRKRRAASSRQWSRARILDQIPEMIKITLEPPEQDRG